MAKAKTKKVSRSAKDGKFVSAKTAKKRPATTVTETVKIKKPKKKQWRGYDYGNE